MIYNRVIPDYFYSLGFDIGQVADATAAALVVRAEEPMEPAPGQEPETCWEIRDGESHQKSRISYRLQGIKRLPLGTSYDDVTTYGAETFRRIEGMGEAHLALDVGGVGRPIFDRWQGMGLRPVGVQFTGGIEINRPSASQINIPKPRLVQNLLTKMGTREFEIAQGGLPEEAILRREFSTMRMKRLANSTVTFQHREGEHDDLLFATCIALWFATNRPQPVRVVKIKGL